MLKKILFRSLAVTLYKFKLYFLRMVRLQILNYYINLLFLFILYSLLFHHQNYYSYYSEEYNLSFPEDLILLLHFVRLNQSFSFVIFILVIMKEIFNIFLP